MFQSFRSFSLIIIFLLVCSSGCFSNASDSKASSQTDSNIADKNPVSSETTPVHNESAETSDATSPFLTGESESSQSEPTNEHLTGLQAGTYALFDTTHGFFVARLFVDKAPITTDNFIALSEGTKAFRDPKTNKMVTRPLYKNRKIFRLIRGFMFQSGSANDTNSYQSGFNITDEFKTGYNFSKAGMLAMANTGRPNSGSCQFFVTFGPTISLNDHYSIFGEVVRGMETLKSIEKEPVRSNGRERSLPVKMPVIHSISIHKIEK